MMSLMLRPLPLHPSTRLLAVDALKGAGVDTVACLSVNDAFVMDAWGASAGADGILMLADGNGDFASAVDMVLDASGGGLGQRCKRFAMIVKDGKVYVQAGGGIVADSDPEMECQESENKSRALIRAAQEAVRLAAAQSRNT